MKKLISTILSIVLLFSIGVAAYADTTKVGKPKVIPITVKVDSKDVKWPIVILSKIKVCIPKPYMQGETLIIPLKPLTNALGYKVATKGKSVTMTNGTNTITMVIGTNKAMVDGIEKTFEEKSILDSKTKQMYLPMGNVATMFNLSQDWFSDTKTLCLYTPATKPDLYTRLFNSNRYEYNSKKYPVYGQDIVPKGKVLGLSYTIFKEKYVDPREVTIDLYEPTFENRQEVKEILKMAYPTEWEKVYALLMQTLREEIYELNDNPMNTAGTYTKYFDGRNIYIGKIYSGARQTSISIGFKGQINKVYADYPNQPAPYHDDDLPNAMGLYRLNED